MKVVGTKNIASISHPGILPEEPRMVSFMPIACINASIWQTHCIGDVLYRAIIQENRQVIEMDFTISTQVYCSPSIEIVSAHCVCVCVSATFIHFYLMYAMYYFH